MARTLDSYTASYEAATKKGLESSEFTFKEYLKAWALPDDGVLVVRFLPDLNEQNPLGFLVERHTHKTGSTFKDPLVLCLKKHGTAEQCPFCIKAQDLYARADVARKSGDLVGEKAILDTARTFYHKKSYVGKVLVISTNVAEAKDTVGKVFKIDLSPQIFKKIQAAFKSGNFDDIPDSLDNGYNFRITQTRASSGFKSYDASDFIYRRAPLKGELLEVAKAGIEDLSNLIYDNAELKHAPELREYVNALSNHTAAPVNVQVETVGTPVVPEVDAQSQSVVEQLRTRAAASKKAAQEAEA